MRTSAKTVDRLWKELQKALGMTRAETYAHWEKAQDYFTRNLGARVTLGCHKDDTWAISCFYSDKNNNCRWLWLRLELEDWLDTPSEVVKRAQVLMAE